MADEPDRIDRDDSEQDGDRTARRGNGLHHSHCSSRRGGRTAAMAIVDMRNHFEVLAENLNLKSTQLSKMAGKHVVDALIDEAYCGVEDAREVLERMGYPVDWNGR